MEAMKIKGNIDPYTLVGKLLNIEGRTYMRSQYRVGKVVITGIYNNCAGKTIRCTFKDEDGYEYTFLEITELEVVRELPNNDYQERRKKKHSRQIDTIRNDLDRQINSIFNPMVLRLDKHDIAELRRIKKKGVGAICEHIDVNHRWVYYKNRLIKEKK